MYLFIYLSFILRKNRNILYTMCIPAGFPHCFVDNSPRASAKGEMLLEKIENDIIKLNNFSFEFPGPAREKRE